MNSVSIFSAIVVCCLSAPAPEAHVLPATQPYINIGASFGPAHLALGGLDATKNAYRYLALKRFSENVNQDEFVDSIAPTIPMVPIFTHTAYHPYALHPYGFPVGLPLVPAVASNIIEPKTVGYLWRLAQVIEDDTGRKIQEIEFESENGKEVEFIFRDGQMSSIEFDLGGEFNTHEDDAETKVADAVGLTPDIKLADTTTQELKTIARLVETDVFNLGFDKITEIEVDFEDGEEVEIGLNDENKLTQN